MKTSVNKIGNIMKYVRKLYENLVKSKIIKQYVKKNTVNMTSS